MITVENLSKRFGRFHALRHLSFTVEPGDALALWGDNGAGKTTAIRCVLGLLRSKGRITVAGHDVRRQGKAARRAIGYVPQELALYDDLRLPEALHFFARLKRADRARTPRVLAEVGLEAHRRKRIGELSGGMKQRMALAIALLADPPLLVLDELTSNLDAAAQSGFMSLLRDLRESGKTILFTSHHLREVETLASRVLALEAGRTAFECQPTDLAERLGARCLLRVYVEEHRIDQALKALRADGFQVTRNGSGLHVEVPASRKGAPMDALWRAQIDIVNFDLAGQSLGHTVLGGDA